MLTQGTTFRCGAHGSLARDIDKQLCKRLSNKSKKGISVQYGYGTVLYSTELYCTVQYDAVKRSVEIRSLSLSLSSPPPHPSHPRRCDSGDFGRRSKMSDRVAGKNMATSDPVTCSWPELQGPLARERTNARNITRAWKTAIKRSLH